MKLTGNTVLVAGGASPLGAGLAKAFDRLGNKVVVAGRRRKMLDDLASGHPNLDVLELDIASPKSIDAAVDVLAQRYPTLNVLVNHGGLMRPDDAGNTMDDAVALTQLRANFLGPVRLASALMPLLRRQPLATIVYISSAAGFTPLASYAVYSATKAALHSYVMSQRFLLTDTSVMVQEIIPPCIGRGESGDPDHPMAMPLEKFIEETMAMLATDAAEIVVDEAKDSRDNVGPHEYRYVEMINKLFLSRSY